MNNMIIKGINIAIFALFMLIASPASAQEKPLISPKSEQGQAKPQEGTKVAIPEKLKSEPLSVRKAYAETQLKSILAQLNTIYTRTQIAVDRLSDKNVQTSASQLELDKALKGLNEAKINIDAFIAIPITAENDQAKNQALLLALREAVRKSEESLQNTRTALIESLSLLKTSVSESLGTAAN